MSKIPQSDGDEEIFAQGDIVEIIRQPMKIGENRTTFEIARRAPGTRLIIVENERMLLTDEYRHEIGDRDIRLPGGKVFDSLENYNSFLERGKQIVPKAREAARTEAVEEAGIKPSEVKLFKKNHSGATVEWDLYYFIVEDFEKVEQDTELGESIEADWYSFDEVKEMCLDGEVQEDRTVGALLQFLGQFSE